MLNTEPQATPSIPVTSDTSLVVLSEAAAGKLTELVEAEQNPNMGLRVYVYSGGCSGFRYGMMLEDQPSSEDVTVETRGIKVYVDRNSTQYLEGAEIDYLDTLMGAGFTVNNPNAVSGCGCGSSFRTAESTGSPGACHH
jgi:iron-sulfur cluster assembly protein